MKYWRGNIHYISSYVFRANENASYVGKYYNRAAQYYYYKTATTLHMVHFICQLVCQLIWHYSVERVRVSYCFINYTATSCYIYKQIKLFVLLYLACEFTWECNYTMHIVLLHGTVPRHFWYKGINRHETVIETSFNMPGC